MVKPTRKHECTIECPYCAKIIDVFKETEVITPSQKAEKRVRYIAEKSIQTTLPIGEP